MSPRGGFRKGAGRPARKTPLAAITLKLDKGLLAAFNAEKKRHKLSGPKLLAKLLNWNPKP